MVSFSPTVDVCEFVIGQRPDHLKKPDDEMGLYYQGALSCRTIEGNPCYRLSLMIKAWFEQEYSVRDCGYWFATDTGREHLGNIIFGDKIALFNECDKDFLESSLKVLSRALHEKITRMDECGMRKTIFWNPDVVIGNAQQREIIHAFYDQFLDFIFNAEETTLRLRRDEERKREIEAIEREISLLSNITTKCIVTKPALYRHPSTSVW